MNVRSWFRRGGALLLSVVLLGTYVYDRAGGNLLPRETPQPQPQPEPEVKLQAVPADSAHFYSSKSSVVFDPTLMPGSKSIVIAPADSGPAQGSSTTPPGAKGEGLVNPPARVEPQAPRQGE